MLGHNDGYLDETVGHFEFLRRLKCFRATMVHGVAFSMLNDRMHLERAFILPSKHGYQNHCRSFFLHFGDVQECPLRIKKYFPESPGEESCKQGEIIFLFLEISCATSSPNVVCSFTVHCKQPKQKNPRIPVGSQF